MSIKIKFMKLDAKAMIPKFATRGASGFDFHACISEINGRPPRICVEGGQVRLIPLGLSCEVPKGYELQIRSRSGLASKGISVLNSPGTVDSDYRGPLVVLLYNHGADDFWIDNGNRIAQGVICQVPKVKIVEVSELSDTERGENGFGSTGI